jgi:hypothetical protein
MVCLFHSDYGTADPEFNIGAASHLGVHGWVVNATLLKSARNIGEAEAIERHLMRGETVSWCDKAMPGPNRTPSAGSISPRSCWLSCRT